MLLVLLILRYRSLGLMMFGCNCSSFLFIIIWKIVGVLIYVCSAMNELNLVQTSKIINELINYLYIRIRKLYMKNVIIDQIEVIRIIYSISFIQLRWFNLSIVIILSYNYNSVDKMSFRLIITYLLSCLQL